MICKEKLYELYIVKKLPLQLIAEMYGCDRTNISYHAKKYGFPKRNKSPVKRVSGEVVGDWILLRSSRRKNHTIWECQCKCGTIRNVEVSALNTGSSKACRTCAMAKTRDDKIVPTNYWLKITLNAKRRGYQVNLTREEAESLLIKQQHRCMYSGWPIDFGRGRKKSGGWTEGETTASLDRKNSLGNYDLSNVQWIHKDINRMKQTFEEEYFLELCQAISNYKRELCQS